MATYYKDLKSIEDYERMLQAHIQMEAKDFSSLINDLKKDIEYKTRQFHFMAGKEGFDIKKAAEIKHLLIQYLGKNVKYLAKKKEILNKFAVAMEFISIPTHMLSFRGKEDNPEERLNSFVTNIFFDIEALDKFDGFEKLLLSECIELKRVEVLKKLYE